MRLNEIHDRYKNDVRFFVIYIREAHPDDGWRVPENLRDRIYYNEPRTDAERTEVASVCQVAMSIRLPMLIDTIDNDAEEKYISQPIRLYLVGRDGRLVYSGEQGPFGFNPDTWEQAIQDELARKA